MQRFRGGLVFKAHRHLYHSILGLRVINNKKKMVTSYTAVHVSRSSETDRDHPTTYWAGGEKDNKLRALRH